MPRVPVFQVSSSVRTADRLEEIGRSLFDAQDADMTTRGPRVTLASRNTRLETDTARGGLWAADQGRLWKLGPKPKLMNAADNAQAAERLFEEAGLLPELGSRRLRYSASSPGGTMVALRRDGQRTNFQLDSQHVRQVTVDLSDQIPGAEAVPVVGGGGRFRLTLGEQGRTLAHQGVWRPVVQTIETELLPQKEADEQFRALTTAADVKALDVQLAYYVAPSFTDQEFVAPVYVYRAEITAGGRTLPMRNVIIPATEYGPDVPAHKPGPRRSAGATPRVRPLPADLKLEPGGRLPIGLRLNRAAARAAGIDIASLLVRDPRGFLVINPNLPAVEIKELGNLLGFYSAGTSWIGLSGGLPGSEANAQGFVDELSAEGWDIRFNWGDANAWESDWNSNDDAWVDAADFVFYTGHADMNGWMLSSPDDGALSYFETGAGPASPGDIWGAQNLEWACVAACGPLQDEVIAAGGGDVFERWLGAFDGLHILLGYGAVTFDTTEEGRRLASYTRSGMSVIDAWMRTGVESQPSQNGWDPPNGPTVWVGAMWVARDGADPATDHLWGHGPVADDPSSPNGWAAIFTPC